MDRDTELHLIERLLAHVDADTRDLAPALVERPVREYLDPVRFGEEQEALFRAHPVVVGHTAQLPEPGSFFTHDHSGVPIVVTRNEAGALQAFLNVCRHRGGKAAGQACGSAKRMTCAYHGWTYDLDGRLRGLPLADGFDGLDREAYGLVPVPVAERHGLIYVRPRPGGPIDLDRFLGGISAEVADEPVAAHLLASRSWEVACNWKVLLDNFLELYHLATLHASNIGPMFEPNRILFDDYGPNRRRVDARRSIRSLAGQPREQWRLLDHALRTYFLFPNTQTFWTQDYFSWLSVWPVAIDRTVCTQLIVADWAADTDRRRAHLQTNLDLFDLTLGEDFAMSEEVQRGLGSGANETVLFGRHEHGAAAVYGAVDEALGRWRCGESVDAW
ncbi:MAG: aromatic ring-hydroxylating dioxygenase subunit alpha [Acidimicrobiales bacterium]|nr:aromatic ring-hydroxylating dioxygenase subunit alpha [Acidimicrobiales bacterium]